MTEPQERWLRLAEADSKRFQLRIARGGTGLGAPPPGQLQSEIDALKPDVVILRLPAGIIGPIHDLISTGLSPVHADTLVYHSRQLDHTIVEKKFDMDLVAELAVQADSDRIADIAKASFRSYRSHYHANPLFDPQAISDGYAEWATSFIRHSSADRETWIVRASGEIVGFATCEIHRYDKCVEIVLNAIDPSHSGRGFYGYLVSQVLLNYRQRGFCTVKISTQVWNYVVQKAWAHAGFTLTQAFDTYHVNLVPGAAQ